MDRFKGLQRIDLKGINMPCFLNVWPNDCSLALKNRLLQIMARSAPGAALAGMASSLARREDWPGCLDGYDAVIETSSASREHPRPRGDWDQGHYYGA